MVDTVAAKHQIEPEIGALLADLKRRLERRFGERSRAVTPSRTATSTWQ